MNIVRRLIWRWQDRRYVNLDLADCERVCTCDAPSLRMESATGGASTTVNVHAPKEDA